MFVVLALMIGLRHEVGGDWMNYLRGLDDVTSQSLAEAILARGEPGYGLIAWVGTHWFGGVYFVNTVCAVLFSWGLMVFCRSQPRPWLALVVAIPYLVTVVAMGYTRQGVAIGFAMIGLIALAKGKVLQFIIWLVIAASFHMSAVILIPLAALAGTKRRILTVLGIGLFSAGMFFLLLQEAANTFFTHYVLDEMESAGAAIRVIMNALPAFLFLLFRRSFNLSAAQRSFWSWMSFTALMFLPLIIALPSSTAVDRIALYWIPVQLYVWSRLPDALGKQGGRNVSLVCAITAYSAAILFVWLTFATYSYLWLPYKFYPWEVIKASL